MNGGGFRLFSKKVGGNNERIYPGGLIFWMPYEGGCRAVFCGELFFCGRMGWVERKAIFGTLNRVWSAPTGILRTNELIIEYECILNQ